MPAGPQISVVLRNHWEATESGVYQPVHAPGQGTPIRAFRDGDAARAFAEEAEHPERLKVDPLTFSQASQFEQLGPAELSGTFRELGIQVPLDGGGFTFYGSWWWSGHVRNLEPAHVARLWQALGGGRFFEVVTLLLGGDLAARPPTVWIVRRVTWAESETGRCRTRLRDHSGRLDFGHLERGFTDRRCAEAFRAHSDRMAQLGQNPFCFVGESRHPVSGRTNLDYPLLHDWLLDCGVRRVPNAAATTTDWRRWWGRNVPKLSPLQQAKAWEAFDRIRFYDVVEVDLDG
jgi:hypothetical protein